jgi:hypothetical protein
MRTTATAIDPTPESPARATLPAIFSVLGAQLILALRLSRCAEHQQNWKQKACSYKLEEHGTALHLLASFWEMWIHTVCAKYAAQATPKS